MHKLITIFLIGGCLLLFFPGLLMSNNEYPPGKTAKATAAPPPPGCIGAQGTIPRYIYENISGNYLDRLKNAPNFPQSPDHVEYLSSLQSSYNWNNNYGSFIRGFIKAPETGGYVFNLTGDDYCEFYLSTDTLPSNIQPNDTTAYIPGWTGITEHDKYLDPATGINPQNSDTIQLVAGNYYYFEVYQKEGGGGDHVQVYWKLPSTINQPDWAIIHGSHLYEYACDPICPLAGTPCDDGDPNTINDQQDGSCHCYGTPVNPPFPCIGERGSVRTLYWDNIAGNYVSDLLSSPNYPLMPDRVEFYDRLENPNLVNLSEYGTRIRGYLYIPESGQYIFNVTGNNETKFFLGTAETPDPNTDLIAHVPTYTDHFEHYRFAEQTSDTLTLNGGTFYSVELLHKENSGSDHFYVFWKTPFARDTAWHVIGAGNFFQYSCELACIPQGTPCDDGNPNTFDDKYDANCNCVGTPCSDPQCTNSLGYTPYDECGSTDKHSNSAEDAWLSCQPAPSPNPARGLSHWIHYDFGALFTLDQAQIWNYNAAGNTGQGFNNVVIDYSTDGTTWTELGTFNWAQATGNSDYQGFIMSEFSGIIARHILITALDNFDGSGCVGISEISFSAFDCPPAGTACDDGNIETINDVYDASCHCAGTPITNACVAQDTILNNTPIPAGSYEIQATITSAGTVASNTTVQFIAGTKVTLKPGFKAERGSAFLARMVPCNVVPVQNEDPTQQTEIAEIPEKTDFSKAFLQLSPNPTRTWTSIRFNVPQSGKVQLAVYSSSGQLITTLVNSFRESGTDHKEFPAHQLPGGVYYITLRTAGEVITRRLVVVD